MLKSGRVEDRGMNKEYGNILSGRFLVSCTSPKIYCNSRVRLCYVKITVSPCDGLNINEIIHWTLPKDRELQRFFFTFTI